jgi:DNA-binding CsgD family transcriptional regulator
MTRFEGIARELSTIEAAHPDLLRERAVSSLRRALACDGVIFYNVHPTANGMVFGAVHSDLSDLPRGSGRAVLPSPTLRVARPKPSERNAFSLGTDRWSRTRSPGRDPLVNAVYAPLGIYDDIRVLAYEGERFVGWLGAVRRGKGKPFDQNDAHALAGLVSPIVRALGLASRLEQADGAARVLITDARGHLQHASADAERWLTASRRAAVTDLVVRFDQRGEPASAIIEGTRADVVRLGGSAGVAYLTSLRALPSLHDRGIETLTKAQREIAVLAASGATANEIARASARSAATVRVHLKSIYQRLEIGTRAELAREVEAWRSRSSDI